MPYLLGSPQDVVVMPNGAIVELNQPYSSFDSMGVIVRVPLGACQNTNQVTGRHRGSGYIASLRHDTTRHLGSSCGHVLLHAFGRD